MYYTRSKETVPLYDAASWIVITFDFEIIVILEPNTPFVWSTRLHVRRNTQSSVCHFARAKLFCSVSIHLWYVNTHLHYMWTRQKDIACT